MTASSMVNKGFQAANGRLNKELHDGRYGGWCARVQDQNQFLQVNCRLDMIEGELWVKLNFQAQLRHNVSYIRSNCE